MSKLNKAKQGQNEDFRDEMLLVYLTSKTLGKYSPYEYLFVLPNDYLEVDAMVTLLGIDRENEELNELDKAT